MSQGLRWFFSDQRNACSGQGVKGGESDANMHPPLAPDIIHRRHAQSTILALPDANILAHTSRSLQIGRALRELGYDVQFASDGKYMSLIRQAGFLCHPHLTLDPERLLEICRKGRTNFFTPDFLARCVEADCELFARVKPDLVLSDFRFSVSTSAEIMQIPHAVTLNALWTNYFSARLSAPENTVYEKFFGKALVSRFPSWLVKVLKELTLRYDVQSHNQVRRHYGLAARRNLFDLVAGDLNLIADLPAFAPTEKLPPHFSYVGPILWQPEIPLPDCFEQIDEAKPTIYVSMGSSGDPGIFQALADAFADTEYQCLVTTAGLTEIANPPANFLTTAFAPGETLMSKCDLVVCQGGNGTVYQALRAGIPILGYPTMHDQHFNMDLVERLKMGRRLSLSPFNARDLKVAVKDMLARSQEYTRQAKILANAFFHYPGETLAAKAIDDFLYPGWSQLTAPEIPLANVARQRR